MRGRERERIEDELGPCPAVGCRGDKKWTQLVCGQDYARLREPERARLDAAWRRYKGERSAESGVALRALQEDLLGVINMRIGLRAAAAVRLPGARLVKRRSRC